MTTYAVSDAASLLGRTLVKELLLRPECERIFVFCAPGAVRGGIEPWGKDDRVTPAVAGPDSVDASQTGGVEVDHAISLEQHGAQRLLEFARRSGARRFHLVATGFHTAPSLLEAGRPEIRLYETGVIFGDVATGEALQEAPLLEVVSRLARLPKSLPLMAPALGYANVVPASYAAAALCSLIHDDRHHSIYSRVDAAQPQAIRDIYNAFAEAAGAPRIVWTIPRQGVRALAAVWAVAERLPGVSVVGEAVASELGAPTRLLRRWNQSAASDAAPTHARLASEGMLVPPLRDYAGVVYQKWRAEADPDRASRAWRTSGLKDRTVMVTGASSGIGRSTALRVARDGARVLVVARRTDELERLCSEIESEGGTAQAFTCDLSNGDSVDRLLARVLADPRGVDVLVNNAGRSIRRPIIDATDRFHDYERTMAVNYFAAVRLTLGLLPGMYERRSGRVINVTTQGIENHAPRFSAYLASKAALDEFGVVAGRELLSRGITFSSIRLPLVMTDMMAGAADNGAFWGIPPMSAERAAALVHGAIFARDERVSMLLPAGWPTEIMSRLAPRTTRAFFHLAGFESLPNATGERAGLAPVVAAVARMIWRRL